MRDNDSLARRFLNPVDGLWHVQVTQGETHVTCDAHELLTTVLGSCIAACIRDPVARVGGMNHFLLPAGTGDDRDAQRYGVNAMELLLNGLFKRGARRERLEAKLFGGATVLAGLSDAGASNIGFAEGFLRGEGIRCVGGDVGGFNPRRIQYWPLSGRARQLSIPAVERSRVFRKEAEIVRANEDHDVEFF